MGLFTRARDIMSANINAALDKAEDPEKLVKHMIREMEDVLIEIKAACASTMASKKKAERDQRSAESQAAHWTERAQLAVDRGREELAREALRAKRRYVEEVESISNEIDELDALVGQYKSDIIEIEEKLCTARERQRLLVQRHIHAVHKKRAQQELRKLDTSKVMVKFEQYEHRIDRAEAEANLVNFGRPSTRTLEDEFRSIERDESIESELEALKQRRHDHAHSA